MSLFKLVAIISAPIALLKTFISVLHGIVASINITTIDATERVANKQKDEGKKVE